MCCTQVVTRRQVLTCSHEHCVSSCWFTGWALYDLLTVAVALQPGIITSSKQVSTLSSCWLTMAM